MRNIFIIGLLFSITLFSCNNSRRTTGQATTAEAEPVAKVEEKDNTEDCPTTVDNASATSDDDRYNEVINNNSYRYTQPSTNFQGASGYGTGSSYAANSYASSAKKEPKNTCPVIEEQAITEESRNFTEEKLYSDKNEAQDEPLENNNEMEWGESSDSEWNSEKENSVWNTSEESAEDEVNSNDTNSNSNTTNTEEENENYDELPW